MICLLLFIHAAEKSLYVSVSIRWAHTTGLWKDLSMLPGGLLCPWAGRLYRCIYIFILLPLACRDSAWPRMSYGERETELLSVVVCFFFSTGSSQSPALLGCDWLVLIIQGILWYACGVSGITTEASALLELFICVHGCYWMQLHIWFLFLWLFLL